MLEDGDDLAQRMDDLERWVRADNTWRSGCALSSHPPTNTELLSSYSDARCRPNLTTAEWIDVDTTATQKSPINI